MNVQPLQVTQDQALTLLREYKHHRDTYDKRDWEIERIYRAISKGKMVISVNEAIRDAGVDELRRPRLAICQADATRCACRTEGPSVVFKPWEQKRYGMDRGQVTIPWNDFPAHSWWRIEARLPRIPPQHRPAQAQLGNYHILWEADWSDIPRDPYLLRRIGKDAWVVLAAWDLTEVELSVLRAHAVS